MKPYYLHHPDLAPGTSHFRLTSRKARRSMRALRGRVSGLCQPTYVLDIPGGYGKVPLAQSAVRESEGEKTLVEDRAGHAHVYPPASEA